MIDLKPRVRSKFYRKIKPSLWKVRTLEFKSPALANYCFGQIVTNGLGYEPVRKAMQESKVHSSEGLQAHLANMDYLVLWRSKQVEREKGIQYLLALSALEDAYKESIRLNEEALKTLVITDYLHNPSGDKIVAESKIPYIIQLREEVIREYEEGKRKNDSKLVQQVSEPQTDLDSAIRNMAEKAETPNPSQESRPWYKRIFGF